MKRTLATGFLLLAFAAAPALATEDTMPDPQVLTASFLHAHPDLKHRLEGLEAYEEGDYEQAFREFQRSARWSDKISQAMVAEMLWKGQGTRADRAQAYAWMDLAAERGYPSLLGMREQYWAQLDAGERERAITVGKGIYDEYGDDVAMERLERRLERGRRQITGSRVGFVGTLQVLVPSENGWMRLSAEDYYSDRYWKPDQYFDWQDRIGRLPPAGVVEVGPLLQSMEGLPHERSGGAEPRGSDGERD